MKKMNKKGFTIVELVIVIAVIAILAAVMIPTFGGIIDKANKSSAEQTAKSLWKEAYAIDLSDGIEDGQENGKAITIEDATYEVKTITEGETQKKVITFTYDDDKYTVTCTNNTTWNTTKNSK
jgi:type IV pilus assembly protein PilA